MSPPIGPRLPEVLNVHRLDGMGAEARALADALLLAWQLRILGWPSGWALGITAGRRTAEEQAALYAKGRTAPGRKVTYRDGYRNKSTHQLEGWSVFDFVLYFEGAPVFGRGDHPEADARYLELGELAERRGWTWGGRWTRPHDPYHLEQQL